MQFHAHRVLGRADARTPSDPAKTSFRKTTPPAFAVEENVIYTNKEYDMKKLDPIHPGEILKEEFLDPLDLSATAFAKVIGVQTNLITRIINGSSSIMVDTSRRLGKALRTTPTFWMNLQSRYELLLAEDANPSLDYIKPVIAA